jgi:hypothetical protein
MSTVEEFVKDMKRISEGTTPEDRAAFEAWVRSLPEAPEHPEQETTVILRTAEKQA